jgi:hypothetical protein
MQNEGGNLYSLDGYRKDRGRFDLRQERERLFELQRIAERTSKRLHQVTLLFPYESKNWDKSVQQVAKGLDIETVGLLRILRKQLEGYTPVQINRQMFYTWEPSDGREVRIDPVMLSQKLNTIHVRERACYVLADVSKLESERKREQFAKIVGETTNPTFGNTLT